MYHSFQYFKFFFIIVSVRRFSTNSDKPKSTRKFVRATPSYPKYSQKWDQYMNTFLRKGECVVCKNPSVVVLRLKCGHGVCIEDLRGYLESALGDVSMFPLKCPMHYQGCAGTVDSKVAKRILREPQYDRFNEFCDRAMYGDGEFPPTNTSAACL